MRDGLVIVALQALGDHDAAEDAAQETIARVLAVLRSRGIPPGYTLEKFTYGTLKHLIADGQRARRRFSAIPAWLASADKSPLERLVSSERVAAVARALNRLERSDRELLERCYVAGQKIVDIARASGQPAERIRKRKSRALERLRALLDNNSESHSRSSHD